MTGPHKSESPLAGGQIAEENTNSATVAPAEIMGNSDKAFATLQARAVYIVSRWSLTRQLDSLADAADWLDRVTGVNSESTAVGGSA